MPVRIWAWFVAGFAEHETSGDDDMAYRWSLVWFRWGATAVYLTIAFILRPGQPFGWAVVSAGFLVLYHAANTLHTWVHTRRGRPVTWFFEATPFLDILAVSLILASLPEVAYPVWAVYILVVFGSSVSRRGSYVVLLVLTCLVGFGLAAWIPSMRGREVQASEIAAVALLIVLAGWFGSARAALERTVLNRLTDSEGQYRGLVEAVSAIPWEMTGPPLRFSYVGPQAEAILGHPVEHWQRPGFWSAHLHPDDRDQAVATRELAATGGANREMEYRMIAADGRTVWLRDLMSPIPGRTGVRGLMVDASRQKLADLALQRQMEQVRLLHDLTQTLLQCESMERVHEAALDALHEGLAADRAAVLLFDPDGVMRFKAWRGLSDKYRQAIEGNSPWSPGEKNPRPIRIPDASKDHRLGELSSVVLGEGIRALAFIPVVHQDQMPGKFMVYYDAPHEFTDEEISLAQTIANHVAIARHRIDVAEALRASEERYRSVISNVPVVLFALDRDGNFLLAEGRGLQGTGRADGEAVGESIFERYGEFPEIVAGLRRAMSGESGSLTVQIEGRWFEAAYAPSRDETGAVTGVTGVAFDITDRKRAEDGLREHQARLSVLNAIARQVASGMSAEETIATAVNHLGSCFTDLRVAYSVIDESGKMTIIKTAQPDGGPSIEGLSADLNLVPNGLDALRKLDAIIVPDVRCSPFTGGLLGDLETVGARAILDVPVGHGNGLVGLLSFDSAVPRNWSEHEIATLKDVADYLSIVLKEAHAQDERQAAEDAVRHLAYHDPLTGLPNRRLLQDRFAQAIARVKRSGAALGVISLDLDRFKVVNDTIGHTVGDSLLKCVGDRLSALVRDGDTVARVGGDEFILLISNIRRGDNIEAVATRMLDQLREPVELAGHEMFVTASLGLAVYPHDGADTESLLRNADLAMHSAKEMGRDTLRRFDDDMKTKAERRALLSNDLRHALDRGEFDVYYQPIADTHTGAVVGLEALLRWQHPEQGLVMPAEFISLAEETGLIVSLGELALRTACSQGKRWQEQGLPPVRIAVNLSPRQFLQPGLAAVVQQVLDETGLEPAFLELEITEGLAMTDTAFTTRTLTALREMGIRLAIDDFGVGQSSLRYLKDFPVHTLKLDMSFVQGATTNPKDAAIVKASVAMGHSLGLHIVAEGVETPEQLRFVSDEGCDEFQGYLLARAAPAGDAEELLKAHQQVRAGIRVPASGS
jgi:diguanylate cyclase (GGDEF)-like protein/PAS domain S-box-containing protein